jgi:hypothetical protein
VSHACDALSSIVKHCSTGVCVAALRAADDIAVVLAAMRRHARSAEVQCAGCGVLGSVAVTSVENATAIVAAGGVDVVRWVLHQHGDVANMKQCLDDALAVLTSSNVGAAVSAARCGMQTVDAVLSSMRRRPNSVAVQERGVGALRFFGGDANSVVTAGGVDVVLSAMRRHVDAVLVQARGCGVLRVLSRGSDVAKMAIAAAGGIDVVMSAMRRHAACVDVQEHGCGALCSLADRSDANNAAIGGAGGVDVVMAAMTRHADSAGVQRRGCDVLRLLATTDGLRASIVGTGGVSLVVSAMRRHADDMSMAQYWSDDVGYTEVGEGALSALVGPRAVSAAACCDVM